MYRRFFLYGIAALLLCLSKEKVIMLKLKQSLFAAAGAALLFLLAGDAAAQTQEQKKNDKTQPQDVRVTNVVPTHPGVPPNAFSVRLNNTGTVSGPEAEGTSFAVTSFTVTNIGLSPIDAFLTGRWGTTSDCATFNDPQSTQEGPRVRVSPGETLHLTFPQPAVFSAKPGASSCLNAIATGAAFIYVVGYRLPPAEQPQQ